MQVHRVINNIYPHEIAEIISRIRVTALNYEYFILKHFYKYFRKIRSYEQSVNNLFIY